MIQFACIELTPVSLSRRRQKGSRTFSCVSSELSFQKLMNGRQVFFQKTSEENLCKYVMLTLVSKEMKNVFQHIDWKLRYLIKSIYFGSIYLYQIRSCRSHSHFSFNSYFVCSCCVSLMPFCIFDHYPIIQCFIFHCFVMFSITTFCTILVTCQLFNFQFYSFE